MTTLAIVGSREYSNLDKVDKFLDSKMNSALRIVTGGAPGVDRRAEAWAKKNNVSCVIIRPIDPKDKFSYLLRNVEIITMADKIIVFWDGKSKGSKFVINYCRARQYDLTVIE